MFRFFFKKVSLLQLISMHSKHDCLHIRKVTAVACYVSLAEPGECGRPRRHVLFPLVSYRAKFGNSTLNDVGVYGECGKLIP